MSEATETKTDAASCMGGLTDEHKLLEPFGGRFKATVKMWMGPGDPHVSTGVMTNTLDLGGRFLTQDYKGDPSDGPFSNFEGRGFWGYDSVNKRFEGVWIDSVATFMQIEHGQVDSSGKRWEMIGEMTNPETMQPMRKRSVIELQDRDHHTMEMYFRGPDGNEFKSMEIAYVRT